MLVPIAVSRYSFPLAFQKQELQKYERWKQTSHLVGRTIWWRRCFRRVWSGYSIFSALDQKYMDEHERLGDALVRSRLFDKRYDCGRECADKLFATALK